MDVLALIKKKPKGKELPPKPGYESEPEDDMDEGEDEGMEMDGPGACKAFFEAGKAGDFEAAFEALVEAVAIAEES